MKNKQIIFTAAHKAELLEVDIPEIKDDEVLLETEYTVVSGGTERANLMGMPNAGGMKFPKSSGYCGIGRVLQIGPAVKDIAVGDRVLCYHGKHKKYNIRPEYNVTKVEQDNLSSLEAAPVIIASMGLGGVRKLELELGESAMVMGLGLLGMFAVLRSDISNGGAPDTISTDITRSSAYRRGGRYGLTMCMSMARTAGMDEESIFRAVTSAPAKALGKEGEWGCLKEGGCADLAVLRYQNEPYSLTDAEGNILADDMGYRCILTMCNGDIVYRD